MTLKRRLFSFMLLLILGLLLFQLYRFYGQRRQLSKNLNKTDEALGGLTEDNRKLQADLEYYLDQENLAKEAKSKFDYKRPGEKMMIVIPQR